MISGHLNTLSKELLFKTNKLDKLEIIKFDLISIKLVVKLPSGIIMVGVEIFVVILR